MTKYFCFAINGSVVGLERKSQALADRMAWLSGKTAPSKNGGCGTPERSCASVETALV